MAKSSGSSWLAYGGKRGALSRVVLGRWGLFPGTMRSRSQMSDVDNPTIIEFDSDETRAISEKT